MKSITIHNIHHIKDYILEIEFSDTVIKQFDFLQLINFNGIAEQLKNIDYFKNVKILHNGRAFGWENNYDCCADWIRYFAKDLDDEWKDIDENIDLNERIKLSRNKIQNLEKV